MSEATSASSHAPGPGNARRLGLALALLSLLLLSAALRFHELGRLSVWLDEAITWERASLPLSELFADSVVRNHVPSYFAFMHFWLQLGDGELMMRLPSAVCGIVRVLLVCAAGAAVGGLRVGVLSALLVAIAPEQLRYDQEARMYAQLGLFTSLALLGVLWLLAQPEARALPVVGPRRSPATEPSLRRARLAWAALVLGTVGALYTHNIAVFLPVATTAAGVLAYALERNGRGAFARNWALAHGLVLLLWAPWLRFLFQQSRQVHRRFWATFPSSDKLLEILSDVYAFGGDEPLAFALVALLLVAGVAALRRRPALLFGLLLLAFLPPLLLLLVSLERPMFISRLILWTGVPLAILLGCAALWLRSAWAVLGLCLSIAVLGVVNLDRHFYGERRKPNWKAALSTIVTTRRPDAIVLLSGGRDRRQVHYYLSRHDQPYPNFEQVDVARKGMVEKVPALVDGRSEVWVVHRGKKGNTQQVVAALRRLGGRQTLRRHFGHSLHIRRFRIRQQER